MIAPTLIVGLGGTGSKIVQKVYKLATPAQRKNLSFVVFDTDINELRDIMEITPAIKTVQTSANLTVGEYLDADRTARDEWFPVNKIMNRKAMTEGAGQVRAISRLAFDSVIQQGRMTPLDEAISELYVMSGDKGNQALRVILVGSLCGGTGSGLLLPVSLYIRNYLKTKLQQGSAVIRGFFILPEVFHKVISKAPEKNNLACNAYAAIREIDSFMMKGDGTLPEAYDLHYMIPRPGSKEQDDIADSPMDFCFLYDAQNIDGKTLLNFSDYLDHAANCIYAQSIAPTSKRSNSSEDNVIGDVVREGGRNRYCGAGSSMMIYPVDDIIRYLTLIWARDNISSEWLDIDRDYKARQKQYQKQRREGVPATPVDRTAHYVSSIKEAYNEKNKAKSFQISVRNMCYKFKPNGLSEIGPYWEAYERALDEYIEDQIALVQDEPDIAELKEDCEAAAKAVKSEGKVNSKKNLAKQFDNWYQNLEEYKKATQSYTESLGERIAYGLFRDDVNYSKTDLEHRIEYWLRQGGEDSMIHPNAARFFLANVLSDLKKKSGMLHGTIMAAADGDEDGGDGEETKERIEEFWKNFEVSAFDDPGTDDKIESKEDHYKAKHLNERNTFKKLIYKVAIEEAKGILANKMDVYYSKTNAFWKVNVSCMVYDAAIKYIESMLRAYDDFYEVLEKKVSSLAKDIDELENMYNIGTNDLEKDGMTVRYVCANKQCMEALSDEVVNMGTSLDIPAELTFIIYDKVRRYAMAEVKPSPERFFSDTYENSILSFYKKSILDHYESTVCMDVLTATAYEAKVMQYADSDMTDDEKYNYMMGVIESTRGRAKPFISKPDGDEPRIIDACTYSSKLFDSEETGRRGFVNTYLGNFGGVADDEMDPNRIVFFQAIYSLKASLLKKFAAPKQSETMDYRGGGDYFNAYYERVGRLHPDSRKSKAISPHIDRWWHVITKLPDLDETYQEKQFYDINAAFFWGILNGYVHYDKDDMVKKVYKLNVEMFSDLHGEDAELVVSNGTPCDNFYEVLDALTIFPKVVKEILDNTEEKISGELNGQVQLKDSLLFKKMEKFRLAEFPINAREVIAESEEEGVPMISAVSHDDEASMGTCRSILEIPILMKRSVPAENYYEESMMGILKAELEEIKNYLHRFCDKIEFQKQLMALLKQQYELFIENIETENGTQGELYRDPLFVRICHVVANELDALYQYDYAEDIRQMLKRKAMDK